MADSGTKPMEIVKDYVSGAIGRITELHGVYYRQQAGFGLYFESKVACELAEFLRRYDSDRDGNAGATMFLAPMAAPGIAIERVLDTLDQYPVVVAPDKECLSTAQELRLDQFQSRGGQVIRTTAAESPDRLAAWMREKSRIRVDAATTRSP